MLFFYTKIINFTFMQHRFLLLLFSVFIFSCNDPLSDSKNSEKQQAIESIIMPDSSDVNYDAIKKRIATIEQSMSNEIPILKLAKSFLEKPINEGKFRKAVSFFIFRFPV